MELTSKEYTAIVDSISELLELQKITFVKIENIEKEIEALKK